MAKATLAEMAAAVQALADMEGSSLRQYTSLSPEVGVQAQRESALALLEPAAHVLRILGTYPDESRAFVVGLLKRHADGR